MDQKLNSENGNVNEFPAASQASFISDELKRIRTMLLDEFPDVVDVHFDFSKELHAHIDVRNKEEVEIVEVRLPTLGAGLFADIRRGGTPKHPFYHRVSARVRR